MSLIFLGYLNFWGDGKFGVTVVFFGDTVFFCSDCNYLYDGNFLGAANFLE